MFTHMYGSYGLTYVCITCCDVFLMSCLLPPASELAGVHSPVGCPRGSFRWSESLWSCCFLLPYAASLLRRTRQHTGDTLESAVFSQKYGKVLLVLDVSIYSACQLSDTLAGLGFPFYITTAKSLVEVSLPPRN